MSYEKTWIRLHTDIRENWKLMLLDFQERWYFMLLLTMKGKGLLDKGIEGELLDHLVARYFEIDAEEVDGVKTQFLELDLIDEHWQPTGWSDRQYESDSSTNRVRKHRKKQQQKSQCTVESETAVLCDVTLDSVQAEPEFDPREEGTFTPTPVARPHGEEEGAHVKRTKRNKKTRKDKKQPWQPASWVNRELWQQWADVVNAATWHPKQLEQAQQALRHVVNELGWPQESVIARSIARGYRSFFPLNAKGQSEKNPNVRIINTAPVERGLNTQIREAQLDVEHWKTQLKLPGREACMANRQKLLKRAEAFLASLLAQQPQTT